VAFDLLQDQVGALARRQDVLAQIEAIDARPDRGRGLNRLRVRREMVYVTPDDCPVDGSRPLKIFCGTYVVRSKSSKADGGSRRYAANKA
jgi:hypothetical protein